MKVGELKKLLEQHPDGMEIWFSPDIAIGEGGLKLESLKVENAWTAGLDGDDIDDEYLFTDDMTELEIKGYLDRGWKLQDNILTKDILVLHSY